jgi:hypothetical protein
MDALDYPIEHFLLMTEITKDLKEISVQILAHEYHYKSFGSWFFTFQNHGQKYRLIFDGKDNELRLESYDQTVSRYSGITIGNWDDVDSLKLAYASNPTVGQVIKLVNKSFNK